MLVSFNGWMFRSQLFTASLLHGSGSDIVSFQYPVLHYVRTELLAGRFPFWNPYILGGHPLHAMGQAGLAYPPNWLLMGFGTFAWIKLSFAFHTLLASLLTYGLANRELGRNREAVWASAVAGVIYGYGGFLAAHTFAGHLNLVAAAAWIPGVWWGLMALADRVLVNHKGADRLGPLRASVLTALTIAMTVLAGSPQVTLLAVIPGGVWCIGRLLLGAYRLSWPRRRSLVGLCIGWGGATILLAVGLSAVQLLPMLQLASWSARGELAGANVALQYSMPQTGLANLLFAWFWGHPDGMWWARVSRWEFSGYVGFITLFPAFLGATSDWRRSVPLLAGAVLSIVAALGINGNLYIHAVDYLPLFDRFRVPARFLAPATLFLALASARGFYGLARVRHRTLAWAILSSVAALLFGWLYLRCHPETIGAVWQQLIADRAHPRVPDGAGLATRWWRAGYALEGLAALVCTGLVLLSRYEKSSRYLAMIAAVAAGLIFAASQGGLIKPGAPSKYRYPADMQELIMDVPEGERMVAFSQRSWNRAGALSRENIAGYDPSLSSRYNLFANVSAYGRAGLTKTKVWALYPTGRHRGPSSVWNLVGVRHAVVRGIRSYFSAGWELVRQAGNYRLLNNPAAVPPAWCAQQVSARIDSRDVAAGMLAHVSSELAAFVEGENLESFSEGDCMVSQAGSVPGFRRYLVEASESRLLVINQQHHPEWHCLVDGHEGRLYSINLLSMGCLVPQGQHVVDFAYRPVTFQVGLALTLITLVGLLFAGLLRRFNFRRRDTHA